MADETERLPLNTLVIVNTCDQPAPRCVAAVVGYEDGRYLCRYVSERLKDWPVMNPRRPTPVSDFGVAIVLEGDSIRTEMVGESTATYEDGKRRFWQDHTNESVPVCPWAFNNRHKLFCEFHSRCGRRHQDVYHVVNNSTLKTLCGRDASEWFVLTISAEDTLQSIYGCAKCRRKHLEAQPSPALSQGGDV